jgi:hypothetical protein
LGEPNARPRRCVAAVMCSVARNAVIRQPRVPHSRRSSGLVSPGILLHSCDSAKDGPPALAGRHCREHSPAPATAFLATFLRTDRFPTFTLQTIFLLGLIDCFADPGGGFNHAENALTDPRPDFHFRGCNDESDYRFSAFIKCNTTADAATLGLSRPKT